MVPLEDNRMQRQHEPVGQALVARLSLLSRQTIAAMRSPSEASDSKNSRPLSCLPPDVLALKCGLRGARTFPGS